MSRLSENILKYRKLNNLSQSDLAEKLFVTPQAVSRWERAETEPDVETIKVIASIFGIGVDELIESSPNGLSKKQNKFIHRYFLISSIVMTCISIIFSIIIFFGAKFEVVFYCFIFISLIYLIGILVCCIYKRNKENKGKKEKK